MIVDFGRVAAAYAQGRPTYPPELFAWLANIAPGNKLAVDCACGCGEATVGLAPYFERVIGTDISEKMLAKAFPVQNGEYRVAAAEHTGLPDHSADLITVAMAVHWFDQPAFGKEALRLLKPGGILCVWSYGEPYTDDEDINAILRRHAETIYSCGPPNLKHVRNGYSSLTLFLDDYAVTDGREFTMRADHSLDQFITYNRSRSSVRAFTEANGFDLAGHLAHELTPFWRGDPAMKRRIYWPMSIKAGRTALAYPAVNAEALPLLPMPPRPSLNGRAVSFLAPSA